MSINERVINVYESLQIKQAEFARQIKISPQTLNNQVKGKNGLSLATLELIAKGYPNLNMRWLICGEGSKWMDYQENGNTDNLIISEPPPQYKTEKKELEESDLSQKRYELLLIEIEALRKRLEMVERELKKKK